MFMSTHRIISLLFLLLSFVQVQAQAIVLKDGTRVSPNSFNIENGKIIRTIAINGNSATSVLDLSNIAELDWPFSTELTESRALLAQGRTEEAINLLKSGKDFFEVFKTLKGGEILYRDIFLAYVEALGQGGKFDETIAAMIPLQKLKLTPEQEVRVKVLKLNIERQTSSDFAAIMGQAKNILDSTDDSATAAAVWSIIGDVHARQKKYEDALMAYLRIPVFYGTQVQRVPEAELNAARMLTKMKRYEDAQAIYTRLIETYSGSQIAETAQKEKTPINGMKNDDSQTPATDEDTEKPAENTSQS